MDQNADLWKHCLECAALSDLGLRRMNNQDSLAVVIAGGQAAWEQRGHLFMVADGMGAHVAGELASKMAVDCVPLTYQKMLDAPPPMHCDTPSPTPISRSMTVARPATTSGEWAPRPARW